MANPTPQINCFTCDILEGRSQMRSLTHVLLRLSSQERGSYRALALLHRDNARLPKKQVEENDTLCHTCHIRIQKSLELSKDKQAVELLVVPQKMHCCLICQGTEDTHDINMTARTNAFIRTGLYIPPGVKCCTAHFQNHDNLLPEILHGLYGYKVHIILEGAEIQRWMVALRAQVVNRDELRTANINMLNDEEVKVLTGVSKTDFFKLFAYTQNEHVGNRVVHHRDLLAFLMKLRQGVADDFVRVICGYPTRQSASMAVSVVRKNLMKTFVPHFLGLQAHPNQEYITEFVTDFAQKLYNPDPQVKRAIIIVDGTYIYIQKSSNYRVLRQSFSMHKGRHLVKPVLLVSPSGRILDVHGPYFADGRNNDASILIEEMSKDRSELREWCRTGDIFLVDRGYRDSLDFLKGIGISAFMPAYMDRGAKQLTYEQANISRYVTVTRWKVESRNGHIKNIFKFLGQDFQITHVKNLGDFMRIACALINAFFGPIEGKNETPDFASRMLERKNHPNVLKELVELENYKTKRRGWVDMASATLLYFPRLTSEDLLEITFGTYQINLARSYVHDKIQRDSDYCIQVLGDVNDKSGLLRARIYSRFRKSTKYFCFIAYKIPGAGDEDEDILTKNDRIYEWYCECKTGARTVGCCAHIASILWYLGLERHERNTHFPSDELLYSIADCAHRPMPLVLDVNALPRPEPTPGPSSYR